MDVVRFRVRHADGRVEELLTESAQVLVGSGAHCEIRLPIGAARVEHVKIYSTPAGLRATAQSLDPPPKLDGVEFTEAPIQGDVLLVVDKTYIDVSPLATAAEGMAPKRAKQRSSARLYAYLALGLAGAAMMYAAKNKHKDSLAEPAMVPDLWGPPVTTCPQSTKGEAESTASSRLDLALAKQERSPFYPEDGVAAVPLLQVAAACFRVAGSDADAADADARAARLKDQMGEQFRVRRMRLQRAIARQEWADAEHEARVLLAFMAGKTGDYPSWLSATHRKIVLKYGGEKHK